MVSISKDMWMVLWTPTVVHEWQIDRPCSHCSGVLQNENYKLKQGSTLQSQVLKETSIFIFFGELFCCFLQNNTNWLCLSLPLLGLGILSCAKWWLYLLIYFRNKHLHLGRNLLTLFPQSPLPHLTSPAFPRKKRKVPTLAI